MVNNKKELGFKNRIKRGIGYISQLASIFPQIAEGAERTMKHINYGTIPIEKRILGKIFSLLVMGFGGVFLIFALFFYLRESLGWSNPVAYFSIGIIIFVIGLFLKIRESDR